MMPSSEEAWGEALVDDEVDYDNFEFKYTTSLAAIRDRLSVIGISDDTARRAFEEARLGRMRPSEHDETIAVLREAHERERIILEKFEFEQWCEDVRFIHMHALKAHSYGEAAQLDLPERLGYMLEYPRSQMLGFPCDDYNVLMRALSMALPPETPVIYDLTELAVSQYFELDVALVEFARSQLGHTHELAQKVIVLTEGKTDRFAIEESLAILKPSVKDFYSFMDFDGFRVPGGASALVTTLKALVGAGVVNRIVAVFDNDTAAHASLRSLRSVSLPSNVRVLHLPDASHCMSYPTLGPTGNSPMNINGLAASIELFFGLDVLTSQGELVPIQWRGYDEGMRQYQGEIMRKDELLERFKAKVLVAKSATEAIQQHEWSAMKDLVEMLTLAFQDTYQPLDLME